MAQCVSCGNPLPFFENLSKIGQVKRCNNCISRFTSIQQQWLAEINRLFSHAGVEGGMKNAIIQHLTKENVPPEYGQPVLQQFERFHYLTNIRYGNIPIIRVDIHLDSDEHAHFDIRAAYQKPAKQARLLPGRVVGTNKKLYFLSDTGSGSVTIDWNNVRKVETTTITETITTKNKVNGKTYTNTHHQNHSGIHITVAKGSGGGEYAVDDPLLAKTLIDSLVRLWKRQLVLYQEQKTTGSVPEHVKNAVYQRDRGKCVQCGYVGQYIEYDHIIPRSKGGPNTVENIQLLCRACNLKKSDRI